MTPEATTALLRSVKNGDAGAADRLFPHVYSELRRLSQFRLNAESEAVTLSATGLVHEVYLKLIRSGGWSDRAHFMAVAARAMRQILTDRARARSAQKRGGNQKAITLHDDLNIAESTATDQILAVDGALNRLAVRDAELARVVELRFFGGMEIAEIADVLGVSQRTVARKWARAKAHLRSDLENPSQA